MMLSTRITLLVTSSLGFVILAVLVAVGFFGSQAIADDARADMARSGAVLDQIFRSDAQFLENQASLIAGQSFVRSLISETDHQTMLDAGRDLLRQLRVDAVRFTDDSGRILAETDDPASHGGMPTDAEAVQHALAGQAWRGITLRHGSLALEVVVPIQINGYVHGTLTSSMLLNSTVAGNLARMLGTQVAFLANGLSIASSSPLAGTIPTPVGKPAPVTINGKKYLALYRPMPFTNEGQRIGFVTLTDFDGAMATYDRFQSIALVIGLCALVGGLVSARWVSRSITDPLASVVQAARNLKSGEWTAQVEITRSDEIGLLQSTFNEMSEALRLIDEGNIATIQALAAAVDAKDSYTEGHSRRVAGYGAQLAKAVGLTPKEIEQVFMSGTLHDVGKIGIPDSILRASGRLSDEDRATMEMHPVLGFAIVSKAPQLHDLLPGIRSHHERWDGAGYPDGLIGEAIPLMARILSIADSFDAMTSDRPYRKGLSTQYALGEIRAGAGTQFDPVLAETFVSIWGLELASTKWAA